VVDPLLLRDRGHRCRGAVGTDGGTNGAVGNGAANGHGSQVSRMGLKHEVATYLGRSTPVRSTPSPSGWDRRSGDRGPGGPVRPVPPAGRRPGVHPEDLAPDELTPARAEELLEAPSSDRVLGTDPESGLPVQVKAGRFGPYVQVGEVVDGAPKPRTSSLFKSMDPATLTFEQAVDLLRIPRVVGTDPDGAEIVAHNGKFGPYLKRGTDSRSLLTEDQLLTVTVDEALALFAQPKTRAATPRPRCARWATTPTPGCPWWSRTAGSGPT